MLLATSNKARRLLSLRYVGQVRPEALAQGAADIRKLAAELPPGFRLLVDLSQLEAMDIKCLPELGRMMEFFDQAGVGVILRVIPDPAKDIGLNILSAFHYPHRPIIITCESILEAGGHLAEG